MDVNVKGTLICCRAVAKQMIDRGEGGSIITVGSVRGFHAHKDGYTAYGTSKAAVHYLTKQMAFEWAENNIRVNCIAPCVFWSPLTEPILSDKESYLSIPPGYRWAGLLNQRISLEPQSFWPQTPARWSQPTSCRWMAVLQVVSWCLAPWRE